MDKSFIFIPIHLDLLYLNQDEVAAEASADFRRLPYFNGITDINPNNPYLSETVVSQPFNNRNYILPAGVHLHWALPAALTRSKPLRSAEDSISFPEAPNRWLISRFVVNNLDQQWVVESDYIYSPEDPGRGDSIVFPLANPPENTPPYRHIGRRMKFDDWLIRPDGDYLTSLTAIGYGDPTFAAFYPNCHSVFGFHDESPRDPAKTSYRLVGWYSDGRKDLLQSAGFLQAVTEMEKAYARAGDTRTNPNSIRYRTLEENYHLVIDPVDANSQDGVLFPDRSFFVAEAAVAGRSQKDFKRESRVEISVGNTPTEALSTYLAHHKHGGSETEKPILEDRLEALYLASGLEHRAVDIGPKFQEARHTKSFTAVSGGTIWTLRPPAAKKGSPEAPPELTLDTVPAHLLNQLNTKQQALDQTNFKVESTRERIFADWYKYMLYAYPPDEALSHYLEIDRVRFFIDEEIQGLNTLAKSAEKLETEVQQLRENLLSALNEGGTPDAAAYELKQIPAPRYWLPTEPAVLITGEDIRPPHRFNQEDPALCRLLPMSATPRDIAGIQNFLDFSAPGRSLRDKHQNNDEESLYRGMSVLDVLLHQLLSGDPPPAQPSWNPFLLDWEIEISPLKEKSNQLPEGRAYEEMFFEENFTLRENDSDLTYQKEHADLIETDSLYSGRSLLAPHAGQQLLKTIDEYLSRLDAADSDPFVVQLREIQTNVHKNFNHLGQSLSGFNAALLGHKQTMQLPIADPLGFDIYKVFARDVADKVGLSNKNAPQPHNAFNPIRSGVMKIGRLEVIDTFGRAKTLTWERLYATDVMTVSGSAYHIHLPPRFVQPARLNLRWLSAAAGDIEMNAHPASSPVCGWLVPNNLDDSLMIYDAAGEMLGLIDILGEFESPPGRLSTKAAAVAARWQAMDPDPPPGANPHLYRLILRLLSAGESFMDDFITALDSALENSEPEDFSRHQDLALMMGRPIAVVRSSLSAELQGLPANNQDWNVFGQDLITGTRNTDNFEHVRFPVRLGEYRQLNDGLLGFWIDSGVSSADKQDIYFVNDSTPAILIEKEVWQTAIQDLGLGEPEVEQLSVLLENNQGLLKKYMLEAGFGDKSALLWDQMHEMGILKTVAPDSRIRFYADSPDIWVNLSGKEKHTFLMLVDPRGVVHATSGVLPVKSISIPPDQYADALKRLRVTFLSAPILTPADQEKVEIAVPMEPGFAWSWLQMGVKDWDAPRETRNPISNAHFSGRQHIREGWLVLEEHEEDETEN